MDGPTVAGTRSTACSRSLRTLRSNVLWALAGNGVYAACQWGMLLALAKLSTPELVGRFALALAITAPVFMFANLQLRTVQATDAAEDFPFRAYLDLRVITTLLAMVVVCALAISRERAEFWVLLGVGLAKAVESVSDIYYGRFQHQERLERLGRSQIAKGLVSVIVFGLVIRETGNLAFASFALAGAWAVVLIAYDVRPIPFVSARTAPEPVRRSPSRHQLPQLIRLSLPLGIVMVLISLNTNIPRYLLERYAGERDLGVFAAMAYLMVAGSTVVTALAQAVSPRLARLFAHGDRRAYRDLVLKLVGFSVVGGVAAMVIAGVFGGRLLTVLYTEEYAGQASVLVWITLAQTLLTVGSFLGVGITSARRFAIQAPLFLAVVATTTVASVVLIPRYGLEGAAYAVVISAVVQVAGSVVLFQRTLLPGHIEGRT